MARADGQRRSILVPEAHALGMLAAIRSLGQAGYRVHAASPRSDAIGFASRHCSTRSICPPLGSDTYVSWLRNFIGQSKVDAIVPGGAFLLAIEPWFEEFQPLLPISKSRAVVYRALSKTDVYETFSAAPPHLRLLDHHPPTVIVARGQHPPQENLTALGSHLYLKADARHADGAVDDLLLGPLSPQMAGEAVLEAHRRYRKVLLQGAVTGRQMGVSLLMDESGNVLAQNCFRDVHDEPTRRGTMSLRRTWTNAAVVTDAIRRLRHLCWQGAAMLEYRARDSDGSFDFIELNPRYWQSLHLDLLAGIDFPRLQMAWFEGTEPGTAPVPRDVICGDMWPGEISRMLEIWRSPRFSKAQRARETLSFIRRVLDLRVDSDYSFPGDRLVYGHRVAEIIRKWLRIQ
jgi:hypothetical protein